MTTLRRPDHHICSLTTCILFSVLAQICLSFLLRPCCCQVTSVMSNSVRPHRRQPTRLHRPWNSLGKHTGVGCHFLLQCVKVKSESEVARSCLTLSDPMDYSLPGSSVHGIFQTGVLEWAAIAFSPKTLLNTSLSVLTHCGSSLQHFSLPVTFLQFFKLEYSCFTILCFCL